MRSKQLKISIQWQNLLSPLPPPRRDGVIIFCPRNYSLEVGTYGLAVHAFVCENTISSFVRWSTSILIILVSHNAYYIHNSFLWNNNARLIDN